MGFEAATYSYPIRDSPETNQLVLWLLQTVLSGVVQMPFYEKSRIRPTPWSLSNHPGCPDRLENIRNERIGVSTFSRYPVLICHDRWQKSCGRSKTPGRGRKSSKSLFSDQYLALSFKMCPEPVKSVNHKLCIFLNMRKIIPWPSYSIFRVSWMFFMQ